ncbi:Tex family protein [Tepidibacillus marianensis]|uniref:Tex family protein n=1 Tax=Tepidibacillus marianensis TaxID=3131995 RepID=UPI0030CC14D8
MDYMESIARKVAEELQLQEKQVKQVLHLLGDGNTIPFIARYRKEMTGNLDEEQLRQIEERSNYLRALHDRKEEVLRFIDEQGKLTVELKGQIEQSVKLQQVEDLYRPFKPKRKTRASIAKEKGLEPFAQALIDPKKSDEIEKLAQNYIDPEKDLHTVEDVIQGGKDIIAEMISDDPMVRQWVRAYTADHGIIEVQAKDKEQDSVYEMYYEYKEPVKHIRQHRTLAINRGEKENFLKTKILIDEEAIYQGIIRRFKPFFNFPILPNSLREVIEDSYKRLLAPSVEREVRQSLTEKAEDQAIHIFASNLRQLLLQPPMIGMVVLGVDPAYRTGCKLAVVDPIGNVQDIRVIYPTPPQSKVEESKKVIKHLVDQFGIEIFVIGNGTASRETEQFIADFIREDGRDLSYIIVSEAGASVYSASELAREEFPDLDVSERSAISIARRMQDPLSELVKIDPKSVGVGQYQHDVAQKKLEESLKNVVESVVNYVGVDANTASVSLLQYISGMNKTVAKNFVSYREKNGRFNSREELKKVPRFGAKTYEQAIGFLRIDGVNPLDKTSIHTESYEATYVLLNHIGITKEEIGTATLKERVQQLDLSEMGEQLGIGVLTLKDIVENLVRPVRDPRDELPKPIFHKDVLKIEDLAPGMMLKGTVRNIVDFGAFIDIGVKEDGLVHISELSEQYVKHPLDVVSVGDIVDVWVMQTDVKRKRISLTMRSSSVKVTG